jgi:phospholipase D1/2
VERETNARKRKIARTKIIVLVLVALALPLLWRFTPLREWINLATILAWQRSVRGHPAAPLFVIAIYLLGSLVFFPITMLTLATIFAFGPLWGNVYAVAGWLLAAAQGYFIGWLIGHDSLHRLTSNRLSGVVNRAEQHGFLTVLGLRVVPVGPFSLINMIVGASAIRFRDFILASLVGRIPGILTMTLFGVQLENALRQPALVSFALLAIVLLALPWLLARPLRHFLRSRRRSPS